MRLFCDLSLIAITIRSMYLASCLNAHTKISLRTLYPEIANPSSVRIQSFNYQVLWTLDLVSAKYKHVRCATAGIPANK